jgi:Glu-tRNA(Gln) amidotransferase subunit E-like FAD-binding protein
MNYKELGLKVGLEIHFQLDVDKKLFCNCSSLMKEKEPIAIVKRKLHPVSSELGEVDVAAQFEYLRNRTFFYEVFKNESCLVELDEEPPHNPNEEALKVALQIARLFNCRIPEQIFVMRKTVIDGSNTSGFQRTMIVGFDGYFEFKGRRINITQVCLEEDAAAIDREENGSVYYKLNRLGVPLVEIDTDVIEGFAPNEIEEVAYQIFLIASSTGKIRKQLGSIRQDVNISIIGGDRVEIKGVQRLGLISKVIEKEIERQLEIIRKREKVKKETRAAKEDGSTEFMRPLPGAERMYPETDIKPIKSAEILKSLEIPESLPKRIERYENEYKISKSLIDSLLKTEYFILFEKLVKLFPNVQPTVIATILSSTFKEIERTEKTEIRLSEERIIEFFDALNRKIIFKEAAFAILKEMNKGKKIDDIIKELNLFPLTKDEIKEIIEKCKREVKDKNKLVGMVLSRVRGRADINEVIKMIEESG